MSTRLSIGSGARNGGTFLLATLALFLLQYRRKKRFPRAHRPSCPGIADLDEAGVTVHDIQPITARMP